MSFLGASAFIQATTCITTAYRARVDGCPTHAGAVRPVSCNASTALDPLAQCKNTARDFRLEGAKAQGSGSDFEGQALYGTINGKPLFPDDCRFHTCNSRGTIEVAWKSSNLLRPHTETRGALPQEFGNPTEDFRKLSEVLAQCEPLKPSGKWKSPCIPATRDARSTAE